MFHNPSPVTKLYLKDILGTTPLSKEEEQELFNLFLKGSSQARAKLINANMRFVLKVAQQYKLGPIPLPDLVSIGAMGLIRALESFDPTRGLKFISYAVWWIKVYITRFLSEQGSHIRLPAHKYNMVKKAFKKRAAGEKLDDDIRKLIQIVEKVVSLEASFDQGAKLSYTEVIPDHKNKQPDSLSLIRSIENFTRELLSELPEREASLLRSIYGIDHGPPQTLREISEAMNISKERVRQLRDKAIGILRHSRHKKILKEKFEECIEAAS